MNIEGHTLDNYDGYYSNKDLATQFKQDSGPMFVIEKATEDGLWGRWRAQILNGPWCENVAFQRLGTFNECKSHLRRAIREEQHIWS